MATQCMYTSVKHLCLYALRVPIGFILFSISPSLFFAPGSISPLSFYTSPSTLSCFPNIPFLSSPRPNNNTTSTRLTLKLGA